MSLDTVPGRDDYSIAIICALGTESDAIEGIFDVIFETRTRGWQKAVGDHNTYTTGRIGRHYVVLAHLPGMGKIHATSCATGLRATFSRIELAIVAGVAGGSGFTVDDTQDIYLGDVIVSTKLVQVDYGRENVDGFAIKNVSEGNLGLPAPALRSFLHKLQTRTTLSVLERNVKTYTKSLSEYLLIDYPSADTDNLFPATYLHKHRSSLSTRPCSPCQQSLNARCEQSSKLSCVQLGCELQEQQRHRTQAVTLGPSVYFGSVCSSDTVRKNGVSRDELVKQHAVLAFEMEGAGIFEILPSIVVKGICDYADSHKNKNWQSYAAITAAACSKALLEEWTTCSANPLSQIIDDDYVNVEEARLKSENVRRECLKSLYSDQIDARLNNIRLAHPRTCQWVFESTEFKSWLDPRKAQEHNRILWIRAKPGAGKSTLMKHIYRARSAWFSDYAYAGHFFHARGADLQKTRLGMLQSLLYQLFAENQRALDKFIEIYSRFGESVQNRQWSQEELGGFLSTCVSEGWLGKTFLLLDALDECDSNDARDIVAFFEDLAISAIHQDCPLFICLSIRYFPNIGLTKCVQLNLESKTEHAVDLDRYIADRLRIEDEAIAKQLSKKANHVFLWAVLVLSSLNKAYDEGADNQTLIDILADTPEELNQIFERLLGRVEQIPAATVIVLQLALFSVQPIDIRALYLLSIASTKPERLLPWSQSGMTVDKLQAYMVTVSRGLLEIVPAMHASNRKIAQFIHESVRDYLLHDLKPRKQDFMIDYSYSDVCHSEIARACITRMSGTPVKWLRRDIDPDLDYATRYVLWHIDMVSDGGKLVELLRGYSKVFVEEWYPSFRPSIHGPEDKLIRSIICIEQPAFLVTGQKINRERLLKALLNDTEAIAMNRRAANRLLYEDALLSAVQCHWVEGVKILLQAGAEFNVKYGGANILQHCFTDILIYKTNSTRFRLLETIAIALIEAIIPSGKLVDDEDGFLLVTACKTASLELIILMLRAGAKPNTPNYGFFPLDSAIEYERADVVRLLDHWGADPNLPGNNPLAFAVSVQDEDLVQELLESGADPNSSADLFTTILMCAIEQANIVIVRKLLAFKADPSVKSEVNIKDSWTVVSELPAGSWREELMALFKAQTTTSIPQPITITKALPLRNVKEHQTYLLLGTSPPRSLLI